MIKVGIVGSDNSHAIAFSRLANVDRVVGNRCRVVAIWGAEHERTQEVAREGQIESIVSRPEDLVGHVDLAVVVDRHGDLHAAHALPFIEHGTPVYVDKPFAIGLRDCTEMLSAARRSGALVTSFSALRWAPATDALAGELARIGRVRAAHFAGPCDFESQYGGPFFYATHVGEVALRLIGEDIETAAARRFGKTVTVHLTWSSGASATLTYLAGAAYHFHGVLFGTEGLAASEITGGDRAYETALRKIIAMVESGERPLDDQQLLRPIVMVHAIQESLARGGAEVRIADVL